MKWQTQCSLINVQDLRTTIKFTVQIMRILYVFGIVKKYEFCQHFGLHLSSKRLQIRPARSQILSSPL